MTIEEFNNLDEESKRVVIFEADKVSELRNDRTKFELFYVPDFYIETKTSIRYNSKRTITSYALSELPLLDIPLETEPVFRPK
jgi:hypothetical protein